MVFHAGCTVARVLPIKRWNLWFSHDSVHLLSQRHGFKGWIRIRVKQGCGSGSCKNYADPDHNTGFICNINLTVNPVFVLATGRHEPSDIRPEDSFRWITVSCTQCNGADSIFPGFVYSEIFGSVPGSITICFNKFLNQIIKYFLLERRYDTCQGYKLIRFCIYMMFSWYKKFPISELDPATSKGSDMVRINNTVYGRTIALIPTYQGQA